MAMELGPIESPGDWALRISQAVGADEYVNPPGGAGLYDVRKFTEKGIKVTIREVQDFEYSCGKYHFVPKLSVIDVLMWNSIEQIKVYLDSQV